jgi:cytochrome c oxidase subunit 4
MVIPFPIIVPNSLIYRTMENKDKHISSYTSYTQTFIVLSLLSSLNILIALIKPVSWTPAIILIICSIQAFIALRNFMHLRYDKLILKIFVGGVFVLYTLIIIITLFDYKFR